jgi:hypothetical protein
VTTATSYDIHEHVAETGVDSLIDPPPTGTSLTLTRTRQPGLGYSALHYHYEVSACAGSGSSRQCSPYRGDATACVD